MTGNGSGTDRDWDVIVVGGGNAALCAATSAAEAGARTLLLERAPREERGGNSRFTAGAVRFAFRGVDDLRDLIPDLTDQELEGYDFGTYTEEAFFEDMARVTNYRSDPELADTLVSQSLGAMRWLKAHGVRFVPNGRQAFMVGDVLTFWGGLALDTWGGGTGLVDAMYEAAERAGVEIRYATRALGLVRESEGIAALRVRAADGAVELPTRAVILASGGFEANAEMRTRYMGPGWDLARVRGTRFNTGDGVRMALEVDAMSWGEWSGGHAVPWDQNAPHFGDLRVGDGFSKLSYPLGIMVNARGERFVDEGEDFRNYTYAKFGKEILRQPGSFAWQVFDARVLDLLRDEYRIREATRIQAGTIDELAAKMKAATDFGAERFVAEVAAFNAAVTDDAPFNPAVLDGRRTRGLAIDKTNWANPLDEPPYQAFAVTCGITFTFGGVRIVADNAQVLDTEERPIPGLYAAGELVGGLFYGNYPGGSGLTSGTVFGRIAGRGAAEEALAGG